MAKNSVVMLFFFVTCGLLANTKGKRSNIMRVKFFMFFCLVVGGYFTLQAQSVSIYELGRPINDYEDNFKNLVSNWTKENITNAERYKLKDISFVETISGPERYNYYRNYFSSDKPVGSAISKRSGGDSEGNSFRELIITPGYAYTEFYDTRGMDERVQAIFTDEFQREARELLSRELNIDTLQLFNEQKYEEKTDTIVELGPHFNVIGHETKYRGYNYTSPAPFSQNFKDIQIEHTKTILDLSMEDARKFILENLLIERIGNQLTFSEIVKPGDKVYAIDFEYHMQPYTAYVVCSRATKKVVWDTFFGRVMIEKE